MTSWRHLQCVACAGPVVPPRYRITFSGMDGAHSDGCKNTTNASGQITSYELDPIDNFDGTYIVDEFSADQTWFQGGRRCVFPDCALHCRDVLVSQTASLVLQVRPDTGRVLDIGARAHPVLADHFGGVETTFNLFNYAFHFLGAGTLFLGDEIPNFAAPVRGAGTAVVEEIET